MNHDPINVVTLKRNEHRANNPVFVPFTSTFLFVSG